MSICPFMSKPDGITPNNVNKLYPCIQTCELYTGKECSLKLLAKANLKISKELLNKDEDKVN